MTKESSVLGSARESNVSKPPGVYERERIQDLNNVPKVGFDMMHYRSKVTSPLKTSRSKIETNRMLRNNMEYSPIDLKFSTNKSREFELWREISENDPPYPDHYDPEYNSNVWRNFAAESGMRSLSCQGRVTESIAKLHPLPIPPYNRQGRYTFAKFLSEVDIIPNGRKNQGEIIRHLSDLKEYKRLKLRSEGRRPPTDLMGRILPPSTMQKYKKRLNDPPEPVGVDNDPPYYIVDIDDKMKPARSKNFPVRYIFKENPIP